MRHISLAIILCAIASVAMAQSFTVYEKDKDRAYNVEDVDSIVFSTEPAAPAIAEPRTVKGRWCSLGTSISWLNENTASYPLTKGYQTRVMEKLAFTNFSNKAVNGGVLSSAISQVALADTPRLSAPSTTTSTTRRTAPLPPFTGSSLTAFSRVTRRRALSFVPLARLMASTAICPTTGTTPRRASTSRSTPISSVK